METLNSLPLKANIITIGDELLLGTIIDRNSAWLAKTFTHIGISVKRKYSIGDDISEIVVLFRESLLTTSLTIVTGGLGPTNDDITKKALCKAFHLKEGNIDKEVLENIARISTMRNFPMNTQNIAQAIIPEFVEVLYNELGTAPGLFFSHLETQNIIVLLPGVTHEMKHIVEKQLIPKLLGLFKIDPFLHKTIHTYGMPESLVAEKIEQIEKELPDFLKLAYLPSFSGVRLRLSQVKNTASNVSLIMNNVFFELSKVLNNIVIDLYGNDLIQYIRSKCLDYNYTISVAESCSGGRLSGLLTLLPGSSQFYKGGIVAYSNEIKESVIGINSSLIKKYGVVSKVIVEEMSIKVRQIMRSDFGLAISGIAGPSADHSDKPVGLVWTAVAYDGGVLSEVVNFNSDREGNMIRAAYYTLNLLRKVINNKL